MAKIEHIFEQKHIAEYLESRNLLKQYKKAKNYLLLGHPLKVRFKEGSGIWYFRINKQFRALSVFDKAGNLIVFKIDNHRVCKQICVNELVIVVGCG